MYAARPLANRLNQRLEPWLKRKKPIEDTTGDAMFLAFAISAIAALLAIIPLLLLIKTSSEHASDIAHKEKAAFRAWKRNEMRTLGLHYLHYATIERQNSGGTVQTLCGLLVQASEKTAAIYDGSALGFVHFDTSIRQHSVVSFATDFDHAKKVAACSCQRRFRMPSLSMTV